MPEKFDLIIAGAGIAGLAAAIEASKQKNKSICVLDRFDSKQSNSYYAQGGIAAAIGKNDSWKSHAKDTLSAGAGLCNENIVNFITKNGPSAIHELQDLGLVFDGDKKPDLGLEGGHGEKRVLHIKGDQTGKEMTEFMKKIAQEQKNIYFFQNSMLEQIICEKEKYGGIKLHQKDWLQSNALIVATGGYAACYEKTTNPPTTLGSGIAIAQQAGCELKGMEFVQFHPTTLRSVIGSNFLVSEAVRGEGGKIVDENGRQLINPLDTRDKVSIAIYKEIIGGKKVFLDARDFESGFFRERFPTVFGELIRHKINPEKDLIPIEASAHYTIGGIKTGIEAKTNVIGIYGAGECTNSGLHGANRLASNSLLEGLVMGKVAGANAILVKNSTRIGGQMDMRPKARRGISTKIAFDAMKKVMWRCCGIVRDEANLKDGLAGIKNLEENIEITEKSENAITRNALIVCRKTIEAALQRKESIGTHYRTN